MKRVLASHHALKGYIIRRSATPTASSTTGRILHQRSISLVPDYSFQNDQYRQLSTTSSKTSEDQQRYILERARALINPERNLKGDDPQTWQEAEAVLKILATRHSSSTLSSSMEQVQYAIRLLDRLASILPQDQGLFASMLDTSMLNRILAKWCQGIKFLSSSQPRKSYKTKRHQRQGCTIVPAQMAEKIDRYRWCSLVQPDHRTFTYILDAASVPSSPDPKHQSNKRSVVLANELLEKLLQVSTDTPSNTLIGTASICIVMKAWIRIGRVDMAKDWLRRMQDLYHNHSDWLEMQPNAIAYTTLINGLAQRGNAIEAEDMLNEQLQDFLSGNEACRPDTRTFNAVLNAWSKSIDDPKAVTRCQTLLTQMQELSSMEWDCYPDQYSLTSVIICCVNNAGPEQAEIILPKLGASTKVSPSIVIYNAILRGYAKSGNVDGAERLMDKVLSTKSVAPDEITFNTVLNAYSKSKASSDVPQMAESLLWKMQDYGISPTVVSYSSVMQCWTKASKHSRDGPERAESILRHMIQTQSHRPNIICYNTVMNAWANAARRDPSALERATRLLDEILQPDHRLQPTESTFRTMFYCIAESGVQDKGKRAKAVVELMERYKIRLSKHDLKLISRLTKSVVDKAASKT
jgi:pentatricopeptide repeat protein